VVTDHQHVQISSRLFTVNGRVGLVDDAARVPSRKLIDDVGAWPPPAPSVGRHGSSGLLIGGRERMSTKPDHFNVSVWINHCNVMSSATDRQQSIAAGVVPQSSCSFSAQPRRFNHFDQRTGLALRCLAARGAMFQYHAVHRLQHAPDMPWAGVQVVASVPCAGRRAAPKQVVTPNGARPPFAGAR